jgi:hypothetical protein
MPYIRGSEDTELQIIVDYAIDGFGPYCFFYVQDEGRGVKEHLDMETVDKFIKELSIIRDKMRAAR